MLNISISLKDWKIPNLKSLLNPCCFSDHHQDHLPVCFTFFRFYLEHRHLSVDIFYSDAFPVLILIVIICTTSLTVHRIFIAASWSERSASEKRESADLSSREIAGTKMLVTTSVYFIACLPPNIVYQLAVFVVPGFSYSGKYYCTASCGISLPSSVWWTALWIL